MKLIKVGEISSLSDAMFKVLFVNKIHLFPFILNKCSTSTAHIVNVCDDAQVSDCVIVYFG